MIEKFQPRILAIFLAIAIPVISFTQEKKVLGEPEAFTRPIDVFDQGQAAVERYLTENTVNKDRRSPWVVISDRDDNPVYSSSSVVSKTGRVLKFRELFYVVDEKKGWIKIAEVPSSSLNKLKSKSIQSIGWVPKEKMLLWNDGLVDPRTKINKKAFLLNRAEDLKNVVERKQDFQELIVDVYSNPETQKKEKERKVYDFYFVFKKEGKMYLLGEEAQLANFNIESKLLGWVHERRLQQWNTRICLEPNFDNEAYLEREKNKSIQVRAFGTRQQATDFSLSGSQNGTIWDGDPVKFDKSQMASSDYKRFKGNVVRFPMFRKVSSGGVEHFRSGVIGSIKVLNGKDGKLQVASDIMEMDMAQLKEQKANLDFKNSRVNLFFLVEGTRRTFAFQQDIVNAIRGASRSELLRNKSVNYGALIYRDIPEGDRISEYKKLTTDLSAVTDFISQADFSNRVDQDDYTALYYGLRQGLKIAGFDDNAINIIIILGSGGDFSVDQLRQRDAMSRYPEFLVKGDKKEQIFQNLADISAHLHSIQLYHDGRRKTGTAYGMQSWHLILETAKYIYNKNISGSQYLARGRNTADLLIQEPSLEHPIGLTTVDIVGSRPGMILLPKSTKSLESTRLMSGINEIVDKSLKYEEVVNKALTANFSGEKIDVRSFSKEAGILVPDLAFGVIDAFEKMKENTKLDYDIIVKAAGEKLSVYTEVYLPLKVVGASKPSYSYVLFMPEEDLLQYQDLIRRNLASARHGGNYPEKRKSLYEMYLALVEQFAGEDLAKKPDDMTRAEVMEIMQGIQREGLKLDIDLDIRIGDIRNERKVANEKIDALIRRFEEVNSKLEFIVKRNINYDFCLVSDASNRYYWLKLDEVF